MRITIMVIIFIIAILFISISKQQNMIVVYTNNIEKKIIPIKLGKFQDSDCGMIIDEIAYTSEVIANNGKTWFFHDHGGMVHWIENKKFKENATIWVMTKDTKKYINGRKAWYSRTDETPMHYGFGAYEIKQNGFIDFKTMSLYMLRGEHLGNPLIKKQLLKEK